MPAGSTPVAARRAAELAMDTRRRLRSTSTRSWRWRRSVSPGGRALVTPGPALKGGHGPLRHLPEPGPARAAGHADRPAIRRSACGGRSASASGSGRSVRGVGTSPADRLHRASPARARARPRAGPRTSRSGERSGFAEKVEPQLPEGLMTKANAPVDVLKETRPRRISAPGSTNPPTGRPKLVSPEAVAGLNISTVRGRAEAVSSAFDGDLYVNSDLPENRTMVAVLLVGNGRQGRPAVDLRAPRGGPVGAAGARRPTSHRVDRLGSRRRADRLPGRDA